MILTDVIPLSEPVVYEPKNTKAQKMVEQAYGLNNAMQSLPTLAPYISQKVYVNNVTQEIQKGYDKLRAQVLLEAGALPNDLREDRQNDLLTLAAQTPRMALSQARRVADLLGFVLIPYAYLSDNALKPPISRDRFHESGIRSFAKKIPAGYRAYVLCPVGFYDVTDHVRYEHDWDIYAGQPNQQALLGLSMAIPAFRSLRADIDSIKEQIRSSNERVARMEVEVKNLTRRIEQVENAAKEDIRRRAMESADLATKKKLESNRVFYAYDPLLLAIPETANIQTGETECIVGPCWGPDFNDIVMTVLGLNKIEGQRTKLSQWGESWINFRWRDYDNNYR